VSTRPSGNEVDPAAEWEHPEMRLAGNRADGVTLDAPGAPSMRISPAGDGWQISGRDDVEGWRLERAEPAWSGFVLFAGSDGEELGRTTSLPDVVDEPNGRHVLLADGRLFRIIVRGPRNPRVELTGWEVPGPYLEALPQANGGWRLRASDAARAIADLRALTLLLAAELLRLDEKEC